MPTSLKATPKDFFLWTGAMVALYGSIISFITLLFEYINYLFPDPLGYYYIDPFSGSMRFAMASLIVLVPVTLILLRFIRKDIARIPEKNDLWVRRWALVLTVFIAGSAIVGDLIALINSFLGGDLTTQFLLKIVVLLLVASATFFHFLADLRGHWVKNPQRAQRIGWIAGALVLVTIIAGFFIIGTPSEVRLMRYDNQKVSDLQNIQSQIVNYWQQKEQVPASLREVEDPLSGWEMPKDPQSNEEYKYEKIGDKSFKLCATFNTEVNKDSKAPNMATYPLEFGVEGNYWIHESGEQCFNRTIDPERYKPYPKPVQ